MFHTLNTTEELVHIRLVSELLHETAHKEYYVTDTSGQQRPYHFIGYSLLDTNLDDSFILDEMIVDGLIYAPVFVLEFPHWINFSDEPKDIDAISDNPFVFTIAGTFTKFKRFPSVEAINSYVDEIKQNDLYVLDYGSYYKQNFYGI